MPVTDPSPASVAPLVSVIVPMRNEAAGIIACLESILASELPPGAELELLVLDGASTDQSAELVAELARRDARVKLLDNPARLQADAFNRGLREARGEYLVRMDAHTRYASDYIAESIRLLEATGAENVGGVQRAEGQSWVSHAIAAAVSSRFAAGDAKYRHAAEPTWVDTVYLGAWRTATVRALGGMRPGWAVNEDYEMNVRLRQNGGRVYLSPTIRSTYMVRASLPKLIRQYLRYGFWKVRTLRAHPRSLRWRQLVAPAFVIGLLLTPLLIHWLGLWGLTHVILYGAANLLASVLTAASSRWSNLPLLPFIFLAIHLSWGIGFLAGWCWWPLKPSDRAPAPV